MWDETPFSTLLGLTLTSIEGMAKGSTEVRFHAADGRSYRLYHEQDCCESVELEDVAGEVEDLIGSPLTMADESSNSDNPPEGEYGPPDSFTWTFYRLATVKGYVTLRWYGESNGYYSESVSFMEVK